MMIDKYIEKQVDALLKIEKYINDPDNVNEFGKRFSIKQREEILNKKTYIENFFESDVEELKTLLLIPDLTICSDDGDLILDELGDPVFSDLNRFSHILWDNSMPIETAKGEFESESRVFQNEIQITLVIGQGSFFVLSKYNPSLNFGAGI